jgi:hypothetical protein
MNEQHGGPPVDPTKRPDDTPESDAPRLLPTIDPESPIGAKLRDTMERLRFADVDPAIRSKAQDLLDGRGSLRDMMSLAEFQPLAERAGESLRAFLDGMSPEQRAEFVQAMREGRTPNDGGPTEGFQRGSR